MTDNYRRLIADSKRKLSELRERRDEIDVEMGKLRMLIFATANMLPDEERDEAIEGVGEETLSRRVGLTAAIDLALERADDWQTPKQVREALEQSGYDLDDYGNAMASIHTVLKRLVTSGRAEVRSAGGKTEYKGKPHPLAKLKVSPFYGGTDFSSSGMNNLRMLAELSKKK